MGGMSNLELGYAAEVISEQLIDKYQIVPKRTITGAFHYCIGMVLGSGITLSERFKKLVAISLSISIILPASGWNQMYHSAKDWEVLAKGQVPTAPSLKTLRNEKGSGVKADYDTFAKILLAGIAKINEVEPKVTWYDTIAGDGDCGTTLVSGGEALEEAIKNHTLRLEDAALGIERYCVYG
ncbi:BAH_G0016160.mRNA.1.CDS.1 [Saccharomyces cerevisiae]|nr:BAH_G0016160.mRNA.1.CDS.1 [Saccharomyces cerevisiae]CAI7111065.1 BAH_G0016160.mRNA.1.CDS.1 [Saccharomyces cerevisiae]